MSRLVVVEPTELGREVLTMVLSSRGHAVWSAQANLRDGVAAARRFRPDALVLHGLRGDGFDPVQMLRHVPTELQIIAMVDAAPRAALGRCGRPVTIVDVRSGLDRLVSALEKPGRHAGASARIGVLTPREEEVLFGLFEGWTTEMIAAVLAISPMTTATHIRRIMRKLDARTRLEAVAAASRLGYRPDRAPGKEPQARGA